MGFPTFVASRVHLKRPPASLFIGYLLFGVFMALESSLRRGSEASSSTAGAEDRGTTRTLGAAYGISLLALPLLSAVRRPPDVPAALGPCVMVAAIALRSWAAATLGRFYTRTLRTSTDQVVVRNGPYAFVRHPGYLGTQLLWVGFGLSSRNWLAGGVCGVLMVLLYRRRIAAEETMLRQKLGQAYAAYMAETPRLIPRLSRPPRGSIRAG